MKKLLLIIVAIIVVCLFIIRIAFYDEVQEILDQENLFNIDRNSGITYISNKKFDLGIMLLGDCILKTNWLSSFKLDRYTGKIICNKDYQTNVVIKELLDLEKYNKKEWNDHNNSNYIYTNNPLNSIDVIDHQDNKTLGIYWDSNSDDFFNSLFESFHNRLNVHSLSKHQEYFIEYEIKETIYRIDSEKSYTTKVLNNEEFLDQMTDGGGELTGYYIDGELKKVTSKIGLSYGVITTIFYLSDNNLIAVKEIEEVFPYNNGTATFDRTKLEMSFEGLYYFDDKEIVNQEISGEKRFSENKSINDLEEMYTETVEEYSSLLKTEYP